MKTEQLPQQQLKMHQLKEVLMQGSKGLATLTLSRSSVPSPCSHPVHWGAFWEQVGAVTSFCTLKRGQKQGIWRAWKPVWVLETLGQSHL